MTSEIEYVKERYARRRQISSWTYDPLNPAVYMSLQEKERALIRWIQWSGLASLHDKRVFEIGCGAGANLMQFIRLGFAPENLVGNELLEERAMIARHLLPEATQIILGDASALGLSEKSFDIVLQSTVFSSIIDDGFQRKLANSIWTLVKTGGGVLWYDFIYNNPKNPDVRGVSVRRIHELFPDAEVKVWHLTLAPPISRLVTKIHPSLYTLFNMLPILRTHVLCWIRKV